ncbi:MAG: hypothetical protein RJA87_2122 [Pseudomonadota bacterium]|jgi:hypothetical protein
MIRYTLACALDHEFEGWFGASADFDDQSARGLIGCPVCGSTDVRKAIMAPAVVGAKNGDVNSTAEQRAMVMQAMEAVRDHVETHFDDVGDSFASEARAIHEGRSEQRGIYGQASPKEVKDLVEDGVPVLPMPPKPVEKQKLN